MESPLIIFTQVYSSNCNLCLNFWPSAVIPIDDGKIIALGHNYTQGFCNCKKKNVPGSSSCEKFERNGYLPRKVLLALNTGEPVRILSNARFEATENRRKGKERDEKNSIVECDDGEIRPSVQPKSENTLFD